MSRRRPFGRLRQLPSGRWQARYPDASGVDVPAPTTFSTKAEAARFLAQVQTDLDRGMWRDPQLGRVTFAEWVDQWLASNPAKRSTTLARDASVLGTHFLPTLGSRPLASITPAHVRGVIDVMSKRLAPSTVRTNVGVLRAVLNAAVEADLIGRSPLRGLRSSKSNRRERVTLTPDQLLALADAVGPRYRALVLLGGTLGLRWSEAIALRVRDIDFLRRTITVAQTISEVNGKHETAETKSTASARTLSVPQFLLDAVAEHLATQRGHPDPDHLVFTGPKGGRLRRSFAARTFNPAVRRAGLASGLTFHGLRHVAASLMVEAGVHPRVIQQRLGHATARLSMELYAHVPDAADRQVAADLDAAFAAVHDEPESADGQGGHAVPNGPGHDRAPDGRAGLA